MVLVACLVIAAVAAIAFVGWNIVVAWQVHGGPWYSPPNWIDCGDCEGWGWVDLAGKPVRNHTEANSNECQVCGGRGSVVDGRR